MRKKADENRLIAVAISLPFALPSGNRRAAVKQLDTGKDWDVGSFILREPNIGK